MTASTCSTNMLGKSILNNLRNDFNISGKLNEETGMSQQLFQFQYKNVEQFQIFFSSV